MDHTADTGFEVRGNSKKEVFEAAALAFFDIMWKAGDRKESKPESCMITGSDTMELMVNFLEEFLYLYDAKGIICTDLKVEKITDTTIHAMVWLRHFNEKKDRALLGVKAITYHQLFIEEKNGRWTARIFLDI
jgi:SHS2 domain-containing protein